MSCRNVFLAGTALALACATPASAEVIYSFDTTSFSPTTFRGGPQFIDATLTIDVSDAAARAGFSTQQSTVGSMNGLPANNTLARLNLVGTGIDNISFHVFAGASATNGGGFSFGPSTFGPSGGTTPFYYDWTVNIAGDLSGAHGMIVYDGFTEQPNMVFGNEGWSGVYSSDNGATGSCFKVFRSCTWSGPETVSEAPEPATGLLLALPVLGLLAARRVNR